MNSQNTRLLATLVAVTALLGASAASAARGWQPKQPTIGIRGLEQLAGGSHTLQPLHRPLSGESFGLPSSSRSGDLPKAVATSRRRAVLRA